MRSLVTIAALVVSCVAQNDPASHGFTINAPGQTSTATFGYGAGLSAGSYNRAQNNVPERAPARRVAYNRPQVYARPQTEVVYNQPQTEVVYSEPQPEVVYNQPQAQVVYSQPETEVVYNQAQADVVYQPEAEVVYQSTPQYVQREYVSTPRYTYNRPQQVQQTNIFANPTIRNQPAKFQYQPPQSKGNVAPSNGYTVNAPGFTKHKSFAGPAVHGANQAFYHASG